MIERIQLLRNVGQFDNVIPAADVNLSAVSLFYAENGRGKTTLAAVLRSLATNNPEIVIERHRLGAQHPPQIVLVLDDGTQVVFRDGSWSQCLIEIAIFDDEFVSANVCAGVQVSTSHRQNLHELILGAQGVALNEALQGYVERIEEHITRLRVLAVGISARSRGPYNVDEYCSLEKDVDIDAKIQEAERRLAATKSADEIQRNPLFKEIGLPTFNVEELNGVLVQTLEQLEAAAAELVNNHISKLSDRGEEWVEKGVNLIPLISKDEDQEVCPFCSQNLDGVDVIAHYRAYFSQGYDDLKTQIKNTKDSLIESHGRDIPAAFERSIREAIECRDFWKQFTILPDIAIDTAVIYRCWIAARDSVLQELESKAQSPLEPSELSAESIQLIDIFHDHVESLTTMSENLITANAQLNEVKEQAKSDNLEALQNELAKITAHKSRFDGDMEARCEAYNAEKQAKAETETQRDQARDALSQYRDRIFPAYEADINDYLQRFSASFRIGTVRSLNTRAGSAASYSVVINENEVNVTAEEGPSFRNTLSAGDRNALALAFFFASLEQDPNLANKIVVIDDPMTSLDEHRTLRTRREIMAMHARVHQIIVMSHSKPFLCGLWKETDRTISKALRFVRAGTGSEITTWDVRNDSISENDKRHELVVAYLNVADPTIERQVAESLRPMLEAFFRVAYPPHFPPGTLLGSFIRVCNQNVGGNAEILSNEDILEVSELKDYANLFHHDTNPAYQTTAINDIELADFAQRVLRFASRG